MHPRFSPAEHANFIAAKAVSHATAYIDGRHDRAELGLNAQSIMIELTVCGDDPQARAILDAARLLAIAMVNIACADDQARRMRWCDVLVALAKMVKHESVALRQSGVQRS